MLNISGGYLWNHWFGLQIGYNVQYNHWFCLQTGYNVQYNFAENQPK